MKKLNRLSLCIPYLLFTVFLIASSPFAYADPTFTVGNESVEQGEQVTVDITVQDFIDITSSSFTLEWDPSKLEYISHGALPQALSGGLAQFNENNTSTGQLGFSWFATSSVSLEADDVLFSVTFNAIGQASTNSPVQFTSEVAALEVSANSSPINATFNDGTVSITAPAVLELAISVTPQSHNFGTVATGSSEKVTVTVSNTGDADLSISSIGLAGSQSFTIADGSDISTLVPNASSDVEIEFSPASEGELSATLTIQHSAGNDVEVSLTGTGQAPSSAGDVTLTINGGNVPAGEEIMLDVTVEGFDNVTSISFTLEWDENVLSYVPNSVGNVPGALAGTTNIAQPNEGSVPGNKLTFSWFATSGATLADDVALLSLQFNAIGQSGTSSNVALTGSPTVLEASVNGNAAGVAANDGTITITDPLTPGINVTPESVNFGEVQTGSSKTLTVTVSNTGTADLQITGTTVDGDGAFAIVSGGSASTVEAETGDTHEIEVSFSPASVGEATATLTVASDAGNVDIALAGTGKEAPSAGTITLTAGSATVPVGGQQAVPFTVEGFSDATGLQFTLTWDSDLLSYVSFDGSQIEQLNGTLLLGEPGDANISDNKLSFVWFSAEGKTLDAESELFLIVFEGQGEGPVNLSLIDTPTEVLASIDSEEAELEFQQGSIEVVSAAVISGEVTYYDGDPVEGALLGLTGTEGQDATSGGQGGFNLLAAAGGDYTLTAEVADDAPPANGVSVIDFTKIARHVAAIELLDSPYKLLAGDVDGNGLVTLQDIIKVADLVLGKATTLEYLHPEEAGHSLWRCVPLQDLPQPNPQNPSIVPTHEEALDYTNLVTNQEGQDFHCFRRGDVDGTWKPQLAPAKLEAQPLSGTVGSSREVHLLTKTQTAGGEVLVPVQVRDFDDVGGVQFTLEWDARALEYVGLTGLELEGLSLANFGEHRTDEGLLTFAWYHPSGLGQSLPDGASLFSVRLRTRDGVAQTAAPVRLTSSVTPILAHDGKTLEVLSVGTTGSVAALVRTGAVPAQFTLRGNYPNPFNPSTTVVFDLPEAGEVELEVFDMTGRKVMALPVQQRLAGAQQSLEVDASSLPSGVYLYRLQVRMASRIAVENGRMTLLK